ncbi:MAG: hypothetical protein JWN97_2322, partial [Nocardioides sp.]|nr:hypothetical protein [Nocardioides sp.]
MTGRDLPDADAEVVAGDPAPSER